MGVAISKDKGKRCGVIYVAFGEPYLLQAMHSIMTLRQHNATLPVVVLHNCTERFMIPDDLNLTFCEFRKLDASGNLNRNFKSSFHIHSPFDRTLFLDCDTEICGDISKGFDFLDHADIAIRPEPAPFSMSVTESNPTEAENLTHMLGEFNSGVIFARRTSNALKVLDRWHEYVVGHNKRDQKHFVRAIAECPEVVIWPLSAAWNYMRYDVRTHARSSLLQKSPFVWHYMDFSYSPSALSGVWRISERVGLSAFIKNTAYVKGKIIRPYLTRYAGMAFIDKLRALPNRARKLFFGHGAAS